MKAVNKTSTFWLKQIPLLTLLIYITNVLILQVEDESTQFFILLFLNFFSFGSLLLLVRKKIVSKKILYATYATVLVGFGVGIATQFNLL